MGIYSFFERKINHLKRYNQIISVLMKYGFEDLVQYMEEKKRFSFLKKLIPNKKLKESLTLSKWEKMRLVCEELGPTFVKFGQILSNRPDLLPPGLIAELEKLQDNVPPMPSLVAKSVIESQLKKNINDVFNNFRETPFASASMAQVHKAELKTGEVVVLKVQRPGIKEMIHEDIKIMYFFAEVFTKRIPSIRSFDPIGLVKNFESSIIKELDFINESINIQRFAYNITNDNDRIFTYTPKVIKEYTTDKLLVMEFIDGIKVSNNSQLDEGGYDRKLIANNLLRSYFAQVFRYGFFHADPHAGNILIMPNNVICFIDYGMMGTILKKDLEQLAGLFLSIKSRDIRRIIKALQQLSEVTSIKNFRDLETDITDFVNSYVVKEIHENEMSNILLGLKNIVITHNLKVPTHFFLLARSLVALEGVARSLDPGLEITPIARPFMIRTIAKNYNPLLFAKRIFNSVYEMSMYMEDFPRDIKNAIRKINTGEIDVNIEHRGIDPILDSTRFIGRQIVKAVIVAGLIIGSSLIIVAGVEPKWNGIPALGIIGIIIAFIISWGLFNSIESARKKFPRE